MPQTAKSNTRVFIAPVKSKLPAGVLDGNTMTRKRPDSRLEQAKSTSRGAKSFVERSTIAWDKVEYAEDDGNWHAIYGDVVAVGRDKEEAQKILKFRWQLRQEGARRTSKDDHGKC